MKEENREGHKGLFMNDVIMITDIIWFAPTLLNRHHLVSVITYRSNCLCGSLSFGLPPLGHQLPLIGVSLCLPQNYDVIYEQSLMAIIFSYSWNGAI